MHEYAAAFEHVRKPEPHAIGRIKRQQIFAGKCNLSLGYLAAFGTQQSADRFQRRALARAVGAEEGDKAPLGHIDRNAFDREKDAVIGHFDIVEAEHRSVAGLLAGRLEGFR